MHSRFFVRPYEFQAPDRRTIWSALARPYFAPYLRRAFGVQLADVQGLDHLQQSLDRQSGIILASNHCRPADPLALALAGARLRQYFYYLTSWHLFQRRRLEVWKLRRFGCMSVLRDTTDHQALRGCIDLLAEAQRPIVIFPEGTFYRQNDRLGSLQGGVSLICRRAARQTDRPIVVHPVAVKFWFIGDATAAVTLRLERIERRFHLRPAPGQSLLERTLQLVDNLISIVERAFLGYTTSGSLEERNSQLAESLLSRIEPPGARPGEIMERVRRLRRNRVNQIAQWANRKQEHPAICAELDLLYLCQLLYSQDPGYLLENPTLERIAETLQRLEEDWLDTDYPVAPMSAVVSFGPAIDARQHSQDREADTLTTAISTGIRDELATLLNRGAPPVKPRRRPREFNPPPNQLTLAEAIARIRATAQAFPASRQLECAT